MIVHPRFYASEVDDRAFELTRLGLRPDLPTGLVLFGGEGSTEMVEIARALNRADGRMQADLPLRSERTGPAGDLADAPVCPDVH